jgi:hypothetical protein
MLEMRGDAGRQFATVREAGNGVHCLIRSRFVSLFD